MTKQTIVGRYAPSPTGQLHLGNLRTALLAWLHCRLQKGRFLLRIEDLDTPRVVAGSADKILQDLVWLGLDWDGEVVYQSQRLDLYQHYFNQLKQRGLLYPCFCSRRELQLLNQGRTMPYPKVCVRLSTQEVARQTKPAAFRLKVLDAKAQIGFADEVKGGIEQNIAQLSGDYIIKRADGFYAYNFAVVVDDLEQGVTDVVRGEDILDSTAQHIYLHKLISDQPALRYWHVPLMRDKEGKKLSKRDGSDSLAQWRASNKNAQQLIYHFACSIGLIEKQSGLTQISAQDLLDCLSIDDFKSALIRANNAR